MRKTLIKEFSPWDNARYEVVVKGRHDYYDRDTSKRFETLHAAYTYAEYKVDDGHRVEVYELEETE